MLPPPFPNLLSQARDEARRWQEVAPKAERYPEAGFDSLLRMLEEAKGARSVEQLEPHVRRISYFVIDQGPPSGGFMPSYQQLADAVNRWAARQS